MLAFANMVDLFPNKFTGLCRRGLAFTCGFLRAFNGFLFGHSSLLRVLLHVSFLIDFYDTTISRPKPGLSCGRM